MSTDAFAIEQILDLICHRRVDRCLWVAGKALPVCARCAGIYIGFFWGTAFLLLARTVARKPPCRGQPRPVTATGRAWWAAGALIATAPIALSAAGLMATAPSGRYAVGAIFGVGAAFAMGGEVLRILGIGRLGPDEHSRAAVFPVAAGSALAAAIGLARLAPGHLAVAGTVISGLVLALASVIIAAVSGIGTILDRIGDVGAEQGSGGIQSFGRQS